MSKIPLKLIPLSQLKKVLAGMVPPVLPKSEGTEHESKPKPKRKKANS